MFGKCAIDVNEPLSVRNDLLSVLEPFDLGVLVLAIQSEHDLVILDAFLTLEFAGELVLELSDGDVARGLAVALLAELLDFTRVFARIAALGRFDLQRLFAVFALDQELRIALFDLFAVFVPLDLGVGVIRLTLQLQLALRFAALLLVQLLLEAVGRIRS